VIGDRLFFILLYRLFPSVLKVMTIVRPETVVRWHRAGFRRYWRWKSRVRGGRPPVRAELRALIRQMSLENVFWGAPRISAVFITNIAESRFSAHTHAQSADHFWRSNRHWFEEIWASVGISLQR
jgi:hypothetical protein